MAAQLPEKVKRLPAIPKQFGQDGGYFFKYYDDLADELDEDMVTSLKAQLDGILIFAGLFAGVNSAFLAFTLPQMSADPADDTNALLFQIMRGANTTITSPADLPSASFSPPTGALPINILFSMSLTLALLASFLAVLGQQWLVYYRKRSGGGAERQRWEQLRRYLGAKRWKLELILDDVLPSVLQIGLVIFCIAFILYLGTLSRSLCYAIAAPLCAVAALILAMAILTAWDHWCPFKSPLTHLMQPIVKHKIAALGRVTPLPASLAVVTSQWLAHIIRSGFVPFVVSVREDYKYGSEVKTMKLGDAVLHRAKNISNWFQSHSERNADSTGYLEVMAVKRVICTSEDPNALIYAATNGQSILDKQLLRQILMDEECKNRLQSFYHSFDRTESYDPWQRVQFCAIASFFCHVVLYCGSLEDFIPSEILISLAEQAAAHGESDTLRLWRLVWFEQMRLEGAVHCPLPSERVECPYRTSLENSVRLLEIVTNGHMPEKWSEVFERWAGTFEPSSGSKYRPLEYVWHLSLGLAQAKVQDCGPSQGADLEEWARSTVNELRNVLAAHQTAYKFEERDIHDVINDAIGTLDSPWKGPQPELDLYGELFERALVVRRNSLGLPSFILPSSVLNDLLILMRFLEGQIRHPIASASTRKLAKEYRNKWSKIFAASLDGEGGWTMSPVVFAESVSCCSDAVQKHLEWMKNNVINDPKNPENAPMVESFKICFRLFPNPDAAFREIGVDQAGAVFGEPVGDYCTLYPIIARALGEIEAAVMPTTGGSSPEKRDVTLSQPEIVGERKNHDVVSFVTQAQA
ncbi:hypothetical protein FS837_003880 [Tulasnella sp. UAMH 9824]|nr:hypothetical protein FS837_003880 [Tulasnella sp. UAMH 9824]